MLSGLCAPAAAEITNDRRSDAVSFGVGAVLVLLLSFRNVEHAGMYLLAVLRARSICAHRFPAKQSSSRNKPEYGEKEPSDEEKSFCIQ